MKDSLEKILRAGLRVTKNRLHEIVFFIFLLIFYLLSLRFEFITGRIIFGVFLWGFLPGYIFNQITGLNKELSISGIVGFAIASSMAIINLPLMFLRASLPFIAQNQINVILFINIIIFLAAIIFSRKEIIPKISHSSRKKQKIVFIISLFPFVLFVIRSIINPYLVDFDGSFYINIMKQVEQTGSDSIFITETRSAFTNVVMSLHFITGEDYISLFKFVLPGFIWLIFMTTLSFLSSERNGFLQYLLVALVVMTSPSLSGHIDRFKPETLVFAMTLPALLCYTVSIIKGKIKYYLLGFIYVLLAFRSHDTGSALALSYISGGIIWFFYHFKRVRPYLVAKNLVLFGIIIFPYWFLLNLGRIFSNIVSVTKFLESPVGSRGLKFDWWFLDSYNSNGLELGWPGWTFVIFYLFNGLFVVVLVILSLFSFQREERQDRKQLIILILPVFINSIIYLTVAEILPRLGIFFLPDRAWNHLFFGSAVILILFFSFSQLFSTYRFARFFQPLLLLNIIGGIAVATYLGVSAGSMVSPSESRIINVIRNSTEKDALILSTQKVNEILVSLYTDRAFAVVNGEELKKLQDKGVENIQKSVLNDYEKSGYIQNLQPLIIRHTTTERLTKMREGGKEVLSSEDRVLSEWNETVVDVSQPDKISQPVYLIYSFTKTNGMMTQMNRSYWVGGVDLSNKELFLNIKGNTVIYKDDAALLLKIK